MAKKDEPFDLDHFIKKVLRGAFKKTPLYQQAKRLAKEEFTVKSKHGKDLRRVHFKCASCQRFFVDKTGAKEIAVDHIEPVIPLDRPIKDLDEYIRRLFCDQSNLQILCNYKGERDGQKSCHKIKTAKERAVAAEFKRKEKQS